MCSFSSLTTIIDTKSQIIDIDRYLQQADSFSPPKFPWAQPHFVSFSLIFVVLWVSSFPFCLLRCLFSLLSGCFFLRSHINFMSICAVPVIIHLISWILIQWEWERIMCKFVSFPKWAHYMLGMSMIFAIILLFIAIFFKIVKTMKHLYGLIKLLQPRSKANVHIFSIIIILQMIEINGRKTIQLHIWNVVAVTVNNVTAKRWVKETNTT